MKTSVILSGLTLVVLSACGKGFNQQFITSNFNQPVGTELDEGAFGNPTMNNMLLQTGKRDATETLLRRFENEVPNTVNFAFNSAQLDATARQALDKQASWIAQFPEIRFRVYGHTDAVGSASYNKRLGLQRANAVVAYLGARGISRSRLEAVASFGETQPVVISQGREPRNRRTVTEVTGFVGSETGNLNGKYAEVVFRKYVESAAPEHGLNTTSTTELAATTATQ